MTSVERRTGFRTYQCKKCLKISDICSSCDRGQVYCSATCREECRGLSSKRSQARYRQSLKGRIRRSVQSRKYRKKIEGHQGSEKPCSNVTAEDEKSEVKTNVSKPESQSALSSHQKTLDSLVRQCVLCGKQSCLPQMYRFGFLTRKTRYKLRL